jgi:hypothetical protein
MDTHTEFSRQASLVLLGRYIRQLGLWAEIEHHVQIRQKERCHSPTEKLLDAFITILAGGHGVVESNVRVRPERALQAAFGRTTCAEQSTISTTFNACTRENVEQLRQALKAILQKHGQCVRHDYAKAWQILDIDMTGLVAGVQAEGATKGYFAHQRHRRGRQLGRVLATRYDELVAERLYEGKRQLEHSFQELVLAAENVLDLPENLHARTVLRVDGGGGDDANIRWVLARGYHLLTKVHSWNRARKLAASVTQWYPDCKVADRELGWVTEPTAYGQPTRQVALRHPKKDKSGQVQWHYQVLVFTLTDPMLFELSGRAPSPAPTPQELLWAAAQAYDMRDGGLETQNRNDKQGLGLSHRNKRAFAAQEMLVLLAQLAHNVIIWARNDLAAHDVQFRKFGVQRLVRDVLQIGGQVTLSPDQHVIAVALNPRHPYARAMEQVFIDDM